MGYVNVRDFAPPAGDDDWTPAFAEAIQVATQNGHAGVLVPADPAPYTVRKPDTVQTPSIDLRGVHGFVLQGEGAGSVIAMIGAGSWRLIHIGTEATDVVVRDLYLSGTQLENADQQSHLIVIGTSAALPKRGGARRVSVVNCKLEGAAGDAVAIAPASSTDPREEVSDITISGCHMLDNGRSGVSNQRLGKRISILHNRFVGTEDQDIDFEPSGDLADSGPSGYLILGNTMVRSGVGVSVTLSGTTPESPSRRNTFAHNQILGGRLGLHDAQDLSIFGNYIEAGDQPGAVIRIGGAVERLLFSGNTVIRPATAAPGTLMNVSSEPTVYVLAAETDVDVASNTLRREAHLLQTGVGPLRAAPRPGAANVLPTGIAAGVDYWAIRVDRDTFQLAASRQDAEDVQAVDVQDAGSGDFQLTRHGFPDTVSIHANRLSTFVPASEGEALMTFANASSVSFRDNQIASFAGAKIDVALKFESRSGVRKRAVAGWAVVGNRFVGDAQQPDDLDDPGPGTFGVAVSMAVGTDTVSDVRVSENTFAGCEKQVQLRAEGPGGFRPSPAVTGNLGDGAPFTLQGVPAVLVGGNLQSTDAPAPAGARYSGPGAPGFAAPIGSLYSRTDGTPGSLLYINGDGVSAWTAIA